MKRKKSEAPRLLTEREQKRTARVEALLAELERQGYHRKDLVVDIRKAYVGAILWVVPFAVLFIGLYNLLGCRPYAELDGLLGLTAFILLSFALIFVHEALHGVTFAAFAPHRFRNIEFGVIWKYMTPYCTCLEPLHRFGYFLALLMPFLVLGLLPCVISLFTGSIVCMIIGLLMISGAGGDLTILAKLLSFPTKGKEVLYVDHPTECGSIVMVRDKQA